MGKGRRPRDPAEAVPTHAQIIAWVNDTSLELRDRALLATLYLTNSRVGEVVKKLRNDQLVIATHKKKRLLVFQNMVTEKNRTHPLRNVIVNMKKEVSIIKPLLEYSKSLPETSVLFDFSRQYAWKLINEITDYGCHWFRHTRITHLVVDYNISASSIQKLAGWSDVQPLSKYTHLRWRDVAEEM